MIQRSPVRSISISPQLTHHGERGGRDVTGGRRRIGLTRDQFSKLRRGEVAGVADVHPVVDEASEVVAEEEYVAPAEEEAEAVQRLPTPDMPTRSDMLDHCATHVPFRAWCPHCVEGRGREFGHRTCEPSRTRAVPTVSFDYCFIGDKGELTSQEAADAEPGAIKVLVIRDNKSKAVFAHVVPVKGANKAALRQKPLSTMYFG